MIGGSYGGAIQLATAAVDHRVDALVPMITWNDLSYALAPNNATRAGASDPGAFKWQWANGFYLDGESQPLTDVEPRPVPVDTSAVRTSRPRPATPSDAQLRPLPGGPRRPRCSTTRTASRPCRT